MDGQKFDRLAKTMSSGVSRRRIAKGLLGGTAAGALALFGVRQSKAAGPPPGPALLACCNAGCGRGLRGGQEIFGGQGNCVGFCVYECPGCFGCGV